MSSIDGAQFAGLAYPQPIGGQVPPFTFFQAQSDLQDYTVDWSDWLANGDVIVASEFTTPADIEITQTSFTGTTATLWVTGGEPHWMYPIVNRVVTQGGRCGNRTLRFIITRDG